MRGASIERYPPADRGRIVVWGLMASYPFGGMAWQALHYLVGLRRLGFDVWYVEDTDRLVCDPIRLSPSFDSRPNVEYLHRQLERVGLENRWIFRPPENKHSCHGAADLTGLRRLYREVDAAVNLCGAQELRPEMREIRRLVYLQTDPAADQVKVANGRLPKIEELEAYDVLFTYGENIGSDDCRIPVERFRWHTTRPPVILDWWCSGERPRAEPRLTTVTSWKRFPKKDVVWRGECWSWSKQDEIRRFVDLPLRSPLPLELALGGYVSTQDQRHLREHGWRLRAASELGDPDAYRDYIRGSHGELTFAKQQYVATHSGWFSDRSVCYLAAGRPVVTQGTGFERHVPVGEGLFAFDDEASALAAIDAIAGDHDRHAQAAREIAANYFESGRVLTDLLAAAGMAA